MSRRIDRLVAYYKAKLERAQSLAKRKSPWERAIRRELQKLDARADYIGRTKDEWYRVVISLSAASRSRDKYKLRRPGQDQKANSSWHSTASSCTTWDDWFVLMNKWNLWCDKERNKTEWCNWTNSIRRNWQGKGMAVTQKDIRDLLIQQDYKCALTGRALTPSTASLDHIVPLSRGGENVIANVHVVLRDVNRAKGVLGMDEFLKMCRDVYRHHKQQRNQKTQSTIVHNNDKAADIAINGFLFKILE